MSNLAADGWEHFPFDQDLAEWLERAAPVALACAADRDLRNLWLRHGRTWFVGVNVFPNDAMGRVAGSGPLSGRAVDVARARYGNLPWDSGQVSVVYPGYPKRDVSESAANHRFRQQRDAAHVDGLLPVGEQRRRYIRESHAFILGIPFTDCGAGAAPLVVWQGSHEIIRQALRSALSEHDPKLWSEVDITDVYHATRREIFASCRRVEVPAKPGEAYLVHRLALHGVAPWIDNAAAPPEGRGILYFRPQIPTSVSNWLCDD